MPASPRPILPGDQISQLRARGEFIKLGKALALADPANALAALGAEEIRTGSERLQAACKAAVAGGALADPDSSFALATISTAWLESLRAWTAFDRIAADAHSAPFNQRYAISTQSVIANDVDEGGGIPVRQLNLALTDPLRPKKVAGIIVIGRELARWSGVEALLDTELRTATAAGLDAAFIQTLLAATSPLTSTGDAAGDIDAMLKALPASAATRPHFILSAEQVRALATERGGDGTMMWPGANAMTGGTIYNIPVSMSDHLPAGTMLLVDASALVANRGRVELDTALHADVEMVDASPQDSLSPAGAAGPVIPLWASNHIGIRVTRYYAVGILRPEGIAAVTNATWGSTS